MGTRWMAVLGAHSRLEITRVSASDRFTRVQGVVFKSVDQGFGAEGAFKLGCN